MEPVGALLCETQERVMPIFARTTQPILVCFAIGVALSYFDSLAAALVG
jgi:hypothetical protein